MKKLVLLFSVFCFFVSNSQPLKVGKKYKVLEQFSIQTIDSLKKFIVQKNDSVTYLGFKDDMNYHVEYNNIVGTTERFAKYVRKKPKTFSEKYDSIRSATIKINKAKALGECNYYKNEIDEFNGSKLKYTRIYSLDDYSFTKDYLSIELRKIDNRRYVIFHSIKDLGCVSSYKSNPSVVKVKLINNDILTFYHHSDVDCGKFRHVGSLNQSEFNRLLKSKINSIRLSGTDYYYDITELNWDTFFIDKLKCIE